MGFSSSPSSCRRYLQSNSNLSVFARFSFPRHGELFADLIDKILVLDPEKRLSAVEALEHEWFWTHPLAMKPSEFVPSLLLCVIVPILPLHQ